MKDSVVEAVREDLLHRSQKGINKYKVTLDRKDLSLKDWLQHAYEECLDQANYLKRCILELEEQENVKEIANETCERYPHTMKQLSLLDQIANESQKQGLY